MSSYVPHAASVQAYLGPDTHANRPAAAAVPNGTLYVCTTHNVIERVVWGAWVDWATLGTSGAAEVNVSTGGPTPRVGELLWVDTDEAAPDARPSYGTTLPASPVDGQEAILVDSTTNPTYQWRFRYNAGSSSAYKWEFVGGSQTYGAVVTSEQITAASQWINLPTNGPQFTFPRAGDYWCEAKAQVGTGAAATSAIGMCFGDVNPVTMNIAQTRVNADMEMNLKVGWEQISVTASSVIKVRYYSTVGSSFYSRVLSVIPTRVS